MESYILHVIPSIGNNMVCLTPIGHLNEMPACFAGYSNFSSRRRRLLYIRRNAPQNDGQMTYLEHTAAKRELNLSFVRHKAPIYGC